MAQHMEALGRANEVRMRRAELKRLLVAGEVTVAEVIEDPASAKAPVYDVIQWQRRWGKSRARRFILGLPFVTGGVRITEKTTCAGMTDRQREAVLGALSGEREAPSVVSGFYSW